MTYFVSCFVCGSEDDNCGHREKDLIVWWRNMHGWTLASPAKRYDPPPVRLIPAPEVPLAAIFQPSEVVTERKPGSGAHNGHDPRSLECGRMPWPENRVTPEIALARRNS